MKTYKTAQFTIKCYTNTKSDKYFIKIEGQYFTARYEFDSKDTANKFFKVNFKKEELRIKVK